MCTYASNKNFWHFFAEVVRKIYICNMKKVIQEVVAERERQNKKWGIQDHNLIEWMSILTEEVGEAAQQANDFHWSGVWQSNNPEDVEHARLDLIANYRTECIQIAAVAIQMVESLDRQLQGDGPDFKGKYTQGS